MAHKPIIINGLHNPSITTGQTYNQSFGAVAKAAIAGTANRLDLMPFIPAVDITVSSLSIDCSTAQAGSNVRILVYSNNNGSPGTKLLESTNLSTSAPTGVKTYTVAYTFLAGTIYWVGTHWSSTSTLRGIPLANSISIGTPAGAGSTMYTLYSLTVTFGSAPTTFTGGTLVAAIGPEVRFGT